MEAQPPAHNRRVYPLSILFVITAGCAIVAGLMTPLLRAMTSGAVGFIEASLTAFAAALFGGFVGGVLGLYHHRRSRGLTWGILVGMLIGAAMGPLALVPVEAAPSLIGLSIVGSVVLVAAAAAFRIFSRSNSTETS